MRKLIMTIAILSLSSLSFAAGDKSDDAATKKAGQMDDDAADTQNASDEEATSTDSQASSDQASTSEAHPVLATECKAGEAYRKVWIEYGSTDGQDCKVNYVRDQEPAKVLWTAENDPTFCVNKAKGLISSTLAAFTCTEVQ